MRNDDEDMARSPQWMQSVENSVLAFVIIDPWGFMANYPITPPDEVCARLDLSAAQPPLIFAIVRAPLEPSLMTANLQGPLVINSMTCRSQQAVQVGSPYSTRMRSSQDCSGRRRRAHPVDGIILLDYATGCLTRGLLPEIIALVRSWDIFGIVDPKITI